MRLAKIAAFIQDHVIAISSFLLIFLVTIFLYSETKKKAAERSEKLFELRADQATQDIHKRLNDYIQILIGGKALFIASDTVERAAWHTYSKNLNLEEKYPGIQGLGYTHFIRPDEMEAHVRQIRKEGFPDYKVVPEGKRPIYSSIIYLEPFTARNLRAFGFDMFSEPIRQSAMRIARDTKQPAMSGKVRLRQETGKDEQAGFLIYLPVYRNNADPETIQERQYLIKGFIYSPFRAKDFMSYALGDDYGDIDIEVYDGTTMNKESLLYSTDSVLHYSSNKARLSKTNTITIANNTWRIYSTAKPSFVQTSDAGLPYFILLGGSIISFLMFFIIWSLSSTRRSNRLKQTITDNATAALFILDSRGYCTFMNPAAEEMTGYSFEEMQQQSLHDMIHHKHPDGSEFEEEDCPIRKALKQKQAIRALEEVFVRKDGSYFDAMCAVQPIIENDSISYTIIEVRDITDEKRTQQAIIESEARFRAMADNAPVIIAITDETGHFIYVNKQWIDFTGNSLKDTLSRQWVSYLHAEDREYAAQKRIKAVEDGVSFRMELRMLRLDGQYRWVAITSTPRFDVDGGFMGHISSIIDITEIKEAERRVKQNAELLQKLFLEVPALVGLVRAPDMQYVLANPLYRSLYGNRPLVGRTIYEAHNEREGDGFFMKIEEVFSTGKPYVGNEVPVTITPTSNGPAIEAYFNLVYQPLKDLNGNVEAVLVFAIEVTELVTARSGLLAANDELSDKNNELLRINSDLDNFVYTASHDLKSPIANIEGLVIMLRDILQGKLDSEDEKVLDMVTNSINKLKGTIADLTEITKVQKELQSKVEPLRFDDILKDVLIDINGLVDDTGTQIKTSFEVDAILYARKNLRSIMYNLVSNAVKYRSPDRTPEVAISTYRQDDYVVLEVADNGLGIKKEHQHKLFSMFKRLHTHVEGTGIGLYIVKRIIENNGGKIKVDSDHGVGTTFRVYFKEIPVEETV
ncbi:CHASE domain-containing protein [Pontibacter sp. BT310]|uniref:histidine kinase n=1 Tax=Pontibacter populi TaxID=890055 RepID=A0ABS6XBM1_9BACT|nr:MULTISPECIES: CHASE domain-containing protein [Pontibacter]MBJ6117654.1 CHASE domain-containing protein [Pontibacter sp. BT310]MBR0570080.1 CHASE domain-containing protein [Microvirga sp. STS03]MBW3364506.1 CHASE domain-containing protein [Pontibacter populi]